MVKLRLRPVFKNALLQGATLALLSSCRGASDPGGEQAGELTSGDSGASASGGQAPPTAPADYPTAPAEECVGEDYDGEYYGRCCSEISCRPAEADGSCPPADDDTLRYLPFAPQGSGSCGCNSEGADLGPFAPDPERTHHGEGECCYALYSIGCVGRPLRRPDRSWVLAPVVERADWGAAEA